jgi:hypothetical protein
VGTVGSFSGLVTCNGGITGSTASFNSIVGTVGSYSGLVTCDGGITGSTASFNSIVGTVGSFSGLTIGNEDILFSKLPKITAGITGDNLNNNSIATTKFVTDKINDIKSGTISIQATEFTNSVTFNGGVTGSTANFSSIIGVTGSYSGLVSFNGGIVGTTASFSDTITVTKSNGTPINCILPEYDTNQLAIDAGLTSGAFYRTGGIVKIVI